MPGPLVSEDRGTCHGGQRQRRGTFTQGPSALVDDTFAAREGHVSPYAHSPTLSEPSTSDWENKRHEHHGQGRG
jgi:hypothetical protein